MKQFIYALIMLLTIGLASAEVTITNVVLTQDASNSQNFVLTATITNPPNDGVDSGGLLELAFYKSTFAVYQSPQSACSPDTPYNVHKQYSIGDGESTKITLSAQGVPAGTYKAVLTHVNRCCTTGTCYALQPFGWESIIRTVTVQDPNANINDQCSTDYQAGQYLLRQGVFNCYAPVCDNPATSTSTARCATTGVCNTGSVQSVTCTAGQTIDVRKCVNAQWVSTGNVCPSEPVPSEPSPVVSPITSKSNFMLYGAIGLLLVGAYMVFKRR